jgi:hypothetical protein
MNLVTRSGHVRLRAGEFVHRPERDVVELAHSERAAVIWALPHGGWGTSAAWLRDLGAEWTR